MKKQKLTGISILLVVLFIFLTVYFGLPHYYFSKGLKLFNSGKYFAAYKQFSNARMWNKNNPNYKYYYAQTLAKFKPTYGHWLLLFF